MFEFLEIDNGENVSQLQYQEIVKEIPDEQRLTFSDLGIISPSAEIMKYISRKILLKYSIIPLFTVLPGNKPLLPKHLKREYWGNIHGKKDVFLYVAMAEPFEQAVLNILRTVTGFSIVSVPVKRADAVKFLAENEYNFTKKTESKKSGLKLDKYLLSLKENYFYVLLGTFIITGIIFLKIYIGN